MLIKTFGCAIQGIEGIIVSVEVSLSKGSHIVLSGLPDVTIKESIARLENALQHSGYSMPANCKITINLSPADVKKTGCSFDLAMAIAILAASSQVAVKNNLSEFVMAGELSLDGSIKPVNGALPIAMQAWKSNYKGLLIPKDNEREAAMVTKIPVYGVSNLREVVSFLSGSISLSPYIVNTREEFYATQYAYDIDFADVKGQEVVKRALTVCAAGGHNGILIGPPGSGKSMMAKRLPTILPPLTLQEALETTLIYSVCGKVAGSDSRLVNKRPFRSPHISSSPAAILGGGSPPLPGEVSLATNGVLFLDEIPEFQRSVLEMLRQPLEDGKISIARALKTLDFPARFVLLGSMNPCPCGYFNHPEKQCVCSTNAIRKYLNKMSGPLMDRLDVQVEVKPVPAFQMHGEEETTTSAEIRERVLQARSIQTDRFKGNDSIHCNAQMTSAHIREFCKLDDECKSLLTSSMKKLQLSGRAYDRILKTARTISDLCNSESIQLSHLAEAISYRSLDKEEWMENADEKKQFKTKKRKS